MMFCIIKHVYLIFVSNVFAEVTNKMDITDCLS